MSNPTKIAVVGSLNVDYFTRVERFPHPGETVTAEGLDINFGGKGANQAVAAARLGAEVEMIGCVGADEMGHRYLERLGDLGVGGAGIRLKKKVATGSAFITLARDANNTIVVVPGANHKLTTKQIEAEADQIANADCLILQNEIPAAVNMAAMEIARANDTRIFYNPAPWRDGYSFEDHAVDCLIVNETEAACLLGSPVSSLGDLDKSPGLVVTRGARSTLANRGGELIELAPPEVEPVDTVGAGDTFVAALAVFAAEGDFEGAVRKANAAAALSTLNVGAQEAMPTREDLE